jgi:hypothetical protein
MLTIIIVIQMAKIIVRSILLWHSNLNEVLHIGSELK